ncbi:MAG: neutral/alkaline non-lysosomal ceramidase N-terminal domain-containing protein [Acidobacteria bacterium]|nr:neutral/alkaline non-lysosomal ceramidase N-terminal domain-containing protein [Acidobacteriota bacterium]
MKPHIAALSSVLFLALAPASQAQVAQPGPLRVGAAKVDITPAPGEWPEHYLGVLDRVYSRAIVIDNGVTSAALVTVDVISLSNIVAGRVNGRIAEELGIPVRHIVLAGTGTHSAPTGGGPPRPGAEPVRNAALEDRIFDSVKQAKEKLQPARMRYGTSVSHINVNRHHIDPKTRGWWEGANYEGVSDKSVRVLQFVSPDGAPIAVYYNYAVFNVIAGTLDLVSGDITGEASRYIEESYDDTVVAALSLGAHGDQNPIYFQQTYDLREIRINEYAKRGEDIRNAMPPPGGVGMDRNDPTVARLMNQQKRMVLSLGQMLGEAVLHAMRGASPDVSNVRIHGDSKMVSCPGRQRTNVGRSGVAGEYVDADPVEIRLGVLVVGDVAIAQVNAIPYAAIGLRLKKESPYARTLLTTRANGMSRAGYVPDDASYAHQIFSVLNSPVKPGCGETAIVDGILDLLPPLVR